MSEQENMPEDFIGAIPVELVVELGRKKCFFVMLPS